MRIPQQLCVVCLVLSFPAVSQQTATKDATAMAIVQRSLAAMGSGQNFMDVQAVGTTTSYGDAGAVSYPITLQATGTASVRSGISKPSGTKTYVTDGANICAEGSLLELTADAQSDLSWRRIDFVPALSMLSAYADPNIQVLYQGTDSVNGATVDVISVGLTPPEATDASQIPQRLFLIDRATSLVAKIRTTNTAGSATWQGPTVEVLFSQYQFVTGFAVPMDQATYVDGVLSQELQLTSIAFNTGLDRSLFTMTC